MLLQWQSKQCTRPADLVVLPTINSSSQPVLTTFPITIGESNPQSFLKRHRSETDVDGEDSINSQRKKRRLRFDLVTSRLSKPYATPATHIIIRKGRRPGPWTKPRISARSPLRRAAILNAVKVKRTSAKNFGPKEAKLLTGLKPQKEPDLMEFDLITQGIRTPKGSMPNEDLPKHHSPPSPSPWGPSNYEALDEDDDRFDVDDAEGIDDEETVYSDFNDLDGADADIDDYDTHCHFGGEEEQCAPWTPETIHHPADAKTGIDQQLGTLSAPCAS
ncbi:MAG: hypothetical protein Q9225_004513 [Loekoesia sp. 1 TL-2023]